MTATAQDVARFTSDGLLLTDQSTAIKDAYPNASDMAEREIEMFFDNGEHGQVLLDELFSYLGVAGRIHEAVEVGDSLGLGTGVPLWPTAPEWEVVDASRNIEARAVLRAFSFDMTTDSYALELVGAAGSLDDVTFDSVSTRFDTNTVSWDNAA